MKRPKAIYSYIAAVGLALITLYTFYVFQDFGPRSVIRRFHIAVVQNDTAEINRLVTEPLPPDPAETNPTRIMKDQVMGLAQLNATYEIVGMRRVHSLVRVGVEYRLPGRILNAVWYVRQTQHDWRIDCRATVNAIFRRPGTL